MKNQILSQRVFVQNAPKNEHDNHEPCMLRHVNGIIHMEKKKSHS